MHGLGNDFVVVDARAEPFALDEAAARVLADRRFGVGCDQLIVMEPVPGMPDVDVFMRIYNAAGGEVDACGNATRCVGHLVMAEHGGDRATVMTNAGLLFVSKGTAPGMVTVDMGAPKFDWRDIPLSEPFHDTRGIELAVGPVGAPVMHTPSVVNVGNPHAVFWVGDIGTIDLERIGPILEHHPLFPERANISVAEVTAPDAIRLKVWERGVGLTRACGTAACAAAVSAARKRLTGRSVTVTLPGGPLLIEWPEETGRILMTGPWALDYEGEIGAELLAPEPA